MPPAVTEWSDAMFTSLAAAMALLFSAIPKILGFLLIVIVGWFIATLVEKGVAGLLRRVRFNELSERAGLADFVDKMGTNTDSAGMVALIVKWLVRIVALVVAFDALGLPAVSEVLRSFLLWLPNVVVAMVVLVIGGLAARALSNIVRGSAREAGLSNAQFLARVASMVVWVFAVIVAIHQVGVATELVNALFIAVVGALALGLALAFGLGGREQAAEMLKEWRAKARDKVDEMKQANEAMGGGGTQGSLPLPADKRHDVEGG